MTLSNEADLTRLKEIGRIVANTLEAMGKAIEPGMTTLRTRSRSGATFWRRPGRDRRRRLAYSFPGATCISVNEEIAHGIPGPRRIEPGDLVNIDVSAEKDGVLLPTQGPRLPCRR